MTDEIHGMLKTFWDELIVDGNTIEVSAKSTSVVDIVVVQLHLKKQNGNTLIVYFQGKSSTLETNIDFFFLSKTFGSITVSFVQWNKRREGMIWLLWCLTFTIYFTLQL